MCWNLLTSTGHTTSKYLYAGDVVGPGEWIPLPQVFRIRWFNSNIVILISNCKQKVKCLLFTIYRWLWHWSKTASPGSANKWCCRVGWCPWEICGKQVSLCFTCKSSFCLCSKHSWFTLIYTLTDIVTDVNCRLLMFRVKRVGIHGIEYRPGCVLRLREMDDVENDYPVYGQVDEIIVWEDEKFFILTELATLSFHHHLIHGIWSWEDWPQSSCFAPWLTMVWSIAYCSKEWQEIYCGEGHMLYWRRTLVDES